MRKLFITLVFMTLTSASALAEEGPVQVYIHRDSEAARQEQQTQSEVLDYQASETEQERKKFSKIESQPYEASDGYMMFGLTPGQSRWEYGF
jgi:D-arabinose 5-phosphate isomerase GutQ